MAPEGIRRFSRVSREAEVRDEADRAMGELLRRLTERLDVLEVRLEEQGAARADDRERVDLVMDEAVRRGEAADGRIATELQRLADRVAAMERRLGSAGPGERP